MNPSSDEVIIVPRHRVFVISGGAFVVQWEINQVQDLLSGRYHAYDETKFEEPIEDWELNQLKIKGVVHQYDNDFVYLCPLPNMGVPSAVTRAYYLNTGLETTQFKQVEQALRSANLAQRFSARMQTEFVVIRGANGLAFANFDEAERAREILVQQVPECCLECVVAFVETKTA